MRHPLARATLAGLALTAASCTTVGGRAHSDDGTVAPSSIFLPLDLATPTKARQADGTPGPEYWQQRCDYSIDAELDEPARTICGRATITYHNHSPAELGYLWLHLEQNAYRPESLARLAGGSDSGLGGVGDSPTDGVRIARLTHAGSALAYREHDTLARVELPEPIAPGASFSFEVEWSFEIPAYGSDRMGTENLAQGTIFQVAQWFPAVAKYDDVHGWNTLPYITIGEFYTDFGDYDVRLTVPRSHIVAATGTLENPDVALTPVQRERLGKARGSRETVAIVTGEEVGVPGSRPAGDQPITWRFTARDVRTFAWASSPSFRWDAAAADNGAGTPVLCQSFYPQEATRWPEATAMLVESIEHYGCRWLAYPYPQASNVNGVVPGMEYPMIIFCSEREDERGLFGVTTHEIGHTWFPMVINTDERRHAWMDEGFNTFINSYAEQERYHDTGGRFADFVDDSDAQPMATFPDQIEEGMLGALAYDKPASMLITLREVVLGPERFDPAFREYCRIWAFKSPRPDDFFRIMENAAGADLAWFWRGWIFESASLDHAIVRFTQPENHGRGSLTIASRGRMVMPALYRVEYEGGDVEDRVLPVEAWAWTSQWTTSWPTQGRVVTRITLDPDARLPDIDRSNNTWP